MWQNISNKGSGSTYNKEQAEAELCQAQFKLGLAKTVFFLMLIFFVFVFPVLKV